MCAVSSPPVARAHSIAQHRSANRMCLITFIWFISINIGFLAVVSNGLTILLGILSLLVCPFVLFKLKVWYPSDAPNDING